MTTSQDTLSKLELNILPDTGILHKWLSQNKPTELALIKTQISAQLKLRNAIVTNISAKRAVSYEAFQIDTNTIDSNRDDIGERVKKLKEADVAEAIENLQKQITIFNHREKLEDQLSAIETAIENLVWTDKASKAKSKISKRDIANKEKELSGLYFNQATSISLIQSVFV